MGDGLGQGQGQGQGQGLGPRRGNGRDLNHSRTKLNNIFHFVGGTKEHLEMGSHAISRAMNWVRVGWSPACVDVFCFVVFCTACNMNSV
eukprot:scaffold1321_cov154-Skeletonema_menzelii.AAC.15